MIMDRKSFCAVLAIALAILAPLMMAIHSYRDVTSNPVIKVKITAYDPRDLLYGHYLLFQYDWNWDKKSSTECNSNKCCLCVEAKEADPKVSAMQCSDAKVNPTCAHIIKGQSWGQNSFSGPPTQYFVDETKALPLESFFRKESGKKDFHLGLSLPSSGKARIEKLYIDGQPYLEYMDSHPEEFVLKDEEALDGVPLETLPVEPAAP